MIKVVFETHSASEDSERGAASGWRHRQLSERGRQQARELGGRDGLDVPYSGGESWREAVTRVGGFLDDLYSRWDGMRVLIIGHVATRWALEHYPGGVPLEDLVQPEFAWQEGWDYFRAHQADDQGRARNPDQRTSVYSLGSSRTTSE